MNYIDLFNKSVNLHANDIALTDFDGDRQITYSQLDVLSKRVASKLKHHGASEGSFILINMERRMEYIIAYLGILKAGCVVVPVVPDYPKERINYISNDCSALLTITIDFFDDINDYEPIEAYVDGINPALLVYTSGSTGVPKGILHSTADLARISQRQTILFNGIDNIRFAATATFSFAIHILEYLTVLLLGGNIIILSDKVRRSVKLLESSFSKFNITVSFISPQILRLFNNKADTLQRVISASERLTKAYSDSHEIYNAYGMSETVLCSYFVVDRSYENTPIGKPFKGLELLICDADGNVLSDGNEGEIYICGDYDVCYYKDNEKTIATMLKLPNGKTAIKSGDIGYKNENGDIVYTNRKDWMVKINGQRVETLEIEILLLNMPEVSNSVVKAFEDDNSQTYLVAYYTLVSEINEHELRNRLKCKLPDYMIPKFFVKLDHFPKNINGKLDRKSLTPPEINNYKEPYIAPTTDLEKLICQSFEKVLDCGKVGICDDFFALGGDSITVLRLTDEIGHNDITAEDILIKRTPKAIAEICKHDTYTEINHIENIGEIYPLTEAQKGVYLECVENPTSVMYNIPIICHLPIDINKERFINSVKTVAKTHKVFNITTKIHNGIPSMVYKDADILITQRKVSDISTERDSFVKPFDLENEPLYRFELLYTDTECVFMFDVHHLIFDGTSSKIFISQIADVYNGLKPTAEPLTVFDISVAEPSLKESNEYHLAQEFFENKLANIDCDSKPIPNVLVEDIDQTANQIIVPVEPKVNYNDIIQFTKSNKITENTLFLGAFAYALAKFNGETESLFCTVNNGRHDPRLSSSIGMFVKTVPLYYNFDNLKSISQFLDYAQKDIFTTINHDCISFGELVTKYNVNIDVTFVYQAELFNNVELDTGNITVEVMPINNVQSDINVMVLKTDNNYKLLIRYKTSLYTEDFIYSFANFYLNVLNGMISVDNFSDICLTDIDDKRKIDNINKTEYKYNDDKTVVDLFRLQAKKTPDNICLVYCDKQYTYREIDELTDRLAKHLVSKGIGKEKIAGVLINRSEYMLICSLGILKAGGAYMPLDPSYPPERLNFMMKDAGAVLLISSDDLNNVINSDFDGVRMSTDEIFKLNDINIELTAPQPNDLFVLLYTSGSTGVPKGVMYNHSNATVTAEWVKRYYSIDETASVSAYASYGFDANVFDTYPAIISGATLHIISDDIRLDLLAVRDYFNKHGITHALMTTQVGRQFALMGGFKTLKHLSVGGERLIPVFVKDRFKMYNLYGPTEGSVITSGFLIDRKYKDLPIGKAVDNLKTYIVDKHGKLLPIGAVGELWIAGPHVTRGYINRPDKTEQAYGENPFSIDRGYERVYRTGDIVRLLEDGNIQFIGRRDAQVKIRGFRIELSEVEEIVRRFPNINDATVVAFNSSSGGKFIVAYIVSDETIDINELKDFIRNEKPAYMIPAVIMQIDAIPLNQNQKVNKKALPVPEHSFEDTTPPQNETQKKIFDIICEVIENNSFGINTSIYDAGLTSIGAVRLNVLLSEAFNIPVKISDIKDHDTVKRLEKFLSVTSTVESYEKQKDYPITQTQNGIFVECSANPNSVLYNIPILFKLDNDVNTVQLADAIKSAINAHPYIKTTLVLNKNGEIRALRNDDNEPCVNLVSCSILPEKTELVKPYKLIDAPLYRVTIYQTDHGNYLFMDFHHIISDGTSEAILMSDIEKAYNGEPLCTEKYTGFEVAIDELNLRNSDKYTSAKAYYDNLLLGCDPECLPPLSPETTDESSGSITKIFGFKTDIIEKYCSDNKMTVNSFFNAVFSFVLSKFTRRDDAIYTTIYNGRNDSRLTSSVTMLVKTIPVFVNLDNNQKISELIHNIQNQLLNSFSNDIYSFAEISRAYGIKSDIMFIYQGDTFIIDKVGNKDAELINVIPTVAKAPITINIYKHNDLFEIVADYRQNMFSSVFMDFIIDAIEQTAQGFINNTYLNEVTMLSDKSNKIINDTNNTDRSFANIPVNRLFEQWVENSPNKVAVTAGTVSLTYNDLNVLANKVAYSLNKLNVKENDIIGIVLDRTVDIPIAELGIIKSSGAFLAMLPSYPDDRISFCLENASSPIVITTEEIKAKRPSLFSADKPYITKTIEELTQNDHADNLNLDIDTNALVYCIYTSGSTGTPKGVMIEHHNLSNFVQTDSYIYELYSGKKSGNVCLALSSISFDMSIIDTLMHLCNGKTVCITSDEDIHNPLSLAKLMLKNHVDTMCCTPSFINNYIGIAEFAQALENIKTIVIGAEAFPVALYTKLKTLAPEMNIINGYGPSECTVSCCAKLLTGGQNISIGSPLANTQFYVVDTLGHILPPYACGELIICGEGVGRGYIKLPEKNKLSFFTMNNLPAYHSGDVVRMNSDGEIEFFGRMDNQVKLRGFRVELDEIENIICSFESITQSKVIVRNNGNEDYLAGFFTATTQIDIDALTSFLKAKLTYYMVPDILMQLDNMPLTPNGKINTKALPEVKKTSKKREKRRTPKKSLEQLLCEIFSSILNVDEIFADDNFFELGGTSLSAAKVTMMLMSENIEVKYGDIFDNPTPAELAEFIETRDALKANSKVAQSKTDDTTTHEALKYNIVKYANQVKRESLGDVLLTGAVGFLGIHVLKEFLDIESGHIYCLVRKGNYKNSLTRLKAMLIYYFGVSFEDELNNRITVIDADITSDNLYDLLSNVSFDTVINCAACVKHFSDNDILEKINVHGVENLISVCKRKNAKLIQISTVSIPGMHTKESYEQQVRMHENELFVIDDMDNKYCISKYHAELKVLDAIDTGLKCKIIRVGNLMGRHSDGEFQVNLETNMFLSGIRGFALMGKYPISHMIDPMNFSPIDCTARAVILLSGTNDMFTAFNADNRYGFDEMKIIDACNRNGIKIVPTEDKLYYAEFKKKLGDASINDKLNGLAAYDIKDAHVVETDNLFTTNILYRIGFSWPLVDDAYLDKAIASIMELDYFDMDDI